MSFLSRWLGGGQTASHPLIQPAEYQARFVDGKQAHTLVDVRMPDEFRSGHIPVSYTHLTLPTRDLV